ncbi:MAG: DciA family protein [Candidatus Limnocylindria bacterium]
MSGREEAGAAVQRALSACMGPGAAEQLALAQVRVAWSEVMAEARLERGPLSSRVTRVTGGTVHVEASDAMLAQELTLRGDALTWAVNERMRGRPGATIVLIGVAVSVGRGAQRPTL